MTEQRTRAKADAKSKKKVLADLSVYADFRAKGETVFTGYDRPRDRVDACSASSSTAHPVNRAIAGQTAEVILAETSLYAESGGQAADQGRIVGDGFDLEVLDVQKPVKGLISHTVKVTLGRGRRRGCAPRAVVDEGYRRGATQAHSATHLVHAALRQMLGPKAHQSGSYNKAGYMRLDFGWNSGAVARDPQRDRGDLEQRRARQPRGRHPRSCRSTRRSRSARWRCSARSTATSCASSTSAARGRVSSARAPTWRRAPRSA